MEIWGRYQDENRWLNERNQRVEVAGLFRTIWVEISYQYRNDSSLSHRVSFAFCLCRLILAAVTLSLNVRARCLVWSYEMDAIYTVGCMIWYWYK
jgi:hypothetical protein